MIAPDVQIKYRWSQYYNTFVTVKFDVENDNYFASIHVRSIFIPVVEATYINHWALDNRVHHT